MIIGSCFIELYINGAASLKDKRKILKSIIDKIHNTYNVSIAEIDYNDMWHKAKLGVACVSNQTRQIHSILNNVINFIERDGRVEIIHYGTNLV
ncbi:MAG TPA: DUF503 domain-containing protein [Clostridiales bacterium]|nr:DUF503 domain-containing protein [Clostridiales bacterium]